MTLAEFQIRVGELNKQTQWIQQVSQKAQLIEDHEGEDE